MTPLVQSFLVSFACGCVCALFTLLFARDIVRIHAYNRIMRARGEPTLRLALFHNYFFGAIPLIVSVAAFISAGAIFLKMVS